MLRLPIGDFGDGSYWVARTPSSFVAGLSMRRPATWASDAGAVTVWWQAGAWRVVWSRHLREMYAYTMPNRKILRAHLGANWEWLKDYAHPFAPLEGVEA